MSRESTVTIPLQQQLLVGGINVEGSADRIEDSEILRSQNMRATQDKLIQRTGLIKEGNNIGLDLATDEGCHVTSANSSAGLKTTTDMTIEVLFKTAASHSGTRMLAARYDGTDGWRLYIDSTGDVVFEVEDTGGDTVEARTVTATSVSTVYIAKATFEDTAGTATLAVYTDGAGTLHEIKVTTTDATVDDIGDTNSNETTIGMDDTNAGSFGNFFTGIISYVRFQNVVDTGIPAFTTGTNVKGLWRATLNGTPELLDHSGDANDMACTNVAAADLTQVGQIMPPLLGNALVMKDVTFASLTRVTVIQTDVRFYSWNSSLGAWQDYGTDIPFAGATASGDFVNFDDIYVLTDKDVQPQKWAGSVQVAALSSTLGATYKARIFRTFGGRGHFFNVIDGASTLLSRHQWSAVSDTDSGSGDWDKTNDNVDLDTTPGQILNVLQLGDNLYVYKERGPIIQVMQTGIASPPFAYRTVTEETTGLVAQHTLVSSGRHHYYLGTDNVYQFNGRETVPIGDKVINASLANINPANSVNAWGYWDSILRQYQLWLPVSDDTYPSEGWIFDSRTKAWDGPLLPNMTNNEFTTGGILQEVDDPTWADLDITWSEADFAWSFQTLQANSPLTISANSVGDVFKTSALANSFDGNAIQSHIITRDFKAFNQNLNAFGVMRWLRVEVALAATAGATITLEYSTDSGDSWSSTQSPVEPTTFDNQIKRYMYYIDVVSDRIRFRIGKTSADSSWLITRVTPRGRFVDYV